MLLAHGVAVAPALALENPQTGLDGTMYVEPDSYNGHFQTTEGADGGGTAERARGYGA